jgi:acyl-CoA thioesterase
MTGELKKRNDKKIPDTGPHRIRMEKWLSCAPFERLLNLEIVEAAEGKSTLKMPFLIDFAQGRGFVHGGALLTLADTTMVMAIKSILSPRTLFFTISLEAKFIRTVKQGIVTAKAMISRQEESVIYGKTILYDEAGKIVMEVNSAFKIARNK